MSGRVKLVLQRLWVQPVVQKKRINTKLKVSRGKPQLISLENTLDFFESPLHSDFEFFIKIVVSSLLFRRSRALFWNKNVFRRNKTSFRFFNFDFKFCLK
jgi:hypothetical protein